MKWLKDGREYLTLPGKSSTTEIRELERVTSKLRVNNAAAQQDAGTYSCQATNAYGVSHFRIDVTVWGEARPDSLAMMKINDEKLINRLDLNNNNNEVDNNNNNNAYL